MSDEQTTSELVEQFNKGQNHALRIVADLLGTSMPTHQNVASKIEALQARVEALEAACETAENFMRGSLKDQKGNNDEQV